MGSDNGPGSVGRAKRVLVADDVALNRLFIKSYLLVDRHVVVEVADGRAAIEKAEENFDILFLDLNMPEVSGWDVLAHYRNHARKRMPIFFITTEIAEDVRRQALSLGASGIFARPVSHDQLRQAMLSTEDKDQA
jgi:CheY-like chemotaxis protein